MHVTSFLLWKILTAWDVYSNNFSTTTIHLDFLGSDKVENNNQDDLGTNQSVTYKLFPCGSFIDEILEEVSKASNRHKAIKEGEGRIAYAAERNFPSFDDDAPTTSTTPRQSNINFKRTFLADSERLFRLSGGKLLPNEKGDQESYHDTGDFIKNALVHQNIFKNINNISKFCMLPFGFRFTSGNISGNISLS